MDTKQNQIIKIAELKTQAIERINKIANAMFSDDFKKYQYNSKKTEELIRLKAAYIESEVKKIEASYSQEYHKIMGR